MQKGRATIGSAFFIPCADSILQIESGCFYYDKIKKVQATNLNQQRESHTGLDPVSPQDVMPVKTGIQYFFPLFPSHLTPYSLRCPITYRLLPLTCRKAPITHHPSLLACRKAPIAHCL